MATRRKKKRSFLAPAFLAVLVAGVGYFAYLIATDKGGVRKTTFQSVTLVRPQDVKEKLPEPEPPKEIPKPMEESRQVMDAPSMEQQSQAAPGDPGPLAGSDLGVDAEGGSGSDSFGLVGRKGGRAVTLGGGGAGGGGGGDRISLLAKYGWYTKKIQDQVREEVKRLLEKDGGFPKGKLQTVVHIVVNDHGSIVESKLVKTCGEPRMDDAVLKSLSRFRISDPPPEGMPKGMTIRITSQG